MWLLPRNIHTTRPSKKLDWKKIGPFKIRAKIGSNGYKLDLSPSMKIHNTFHISVLKPYEDNKFPSQIQEPPRSIEIEREDENELDEILDSRLHYNKLQYRAKWTSYPPEHDKVWYLPVTSNMPETSSNDFITIILRNQDGITIIENENNSNLPTQEEVRKEEEEWNASIEKANIEENRHAGMSWIDCHDDPCLVHMSEKDGSWWFPEQPRRQPPTAPHADLPRDKCNRWGCQVPVHKAGKKSRTTSAKRGGKNPRSPKTPTGTTSTRRWPTPPNTYRKRSRSSSKRRGS